MSLGHIYTSANESLGANCLYTVSNAKCQILFVGVAYIAEIFRFGDLLRNPMFNSEEVYRIDIIAKYDRALDAVNAQAVYLKEIGGAPLNKTGTVNRRMSNVKCVQTGIVYRNASEAARVMGLNQSAMSQHLARKPGFRSIKGYTFEYVNYFDHDLKRTALEPLTAYPHAHGITPATDIYNPKTE